MHFDFIKKSRIANRDVGVSSADLVFEFRRSPEGVVPQEVHPLDDEEDGEAESDQETNK